MYDITCFYNRIFLKKNHENRENGLVASYEGSFVEKVFDLTNKFIPSVQRSRLSFFHRSNQKEDLNERRTSLFKQWGIVYLYYQFIFTETPFISNLSQEFARKERKNEMIVIFLRMMRTST